MTNYAVEAGAKPTDKTTERLGDNSQSFVLFQFSRD